MSIRTPIYQQLQQQKEGEALPDGDQPAPSAAPGPSPAPAPVPSSPAPQPRVLSIPESAMARIKEKERESARQQMRAELDAEAKTLGFRDFDDLKQQRAAAARAAARGEEKPREPGQQPSDQASQQQGPGSRKARQQQNIAQAALQRLQEANRQRAHEERKRKQLEQRSAAREAEIQLREAAIRAGVQDVDFAIHILQTQLRSMPREKLEQFDEQKWFKETLKAERPYLFGVSTEPAHTSPSNDPPPRAGSGQGAPPAQPPGQIDVRKLSQEEYRAYLAKRGLADPTLGIA